MDSVVGSKCCSNSQMSTLPGSILFESTFSYCRFYMSRKSNLQALWTNCCANMQCKVITRVNITNKKILSMAMLPDLSTIIRMLTFSMTMLTC